MPTGNLAYMFGYNPTVQNRAGEISAQGTINSANSIASGIGQATQGIGGALNQLNAIRLQAKQADATAQVANGMGIIDDKTLSAIQGLPWDQKINMGSNLIQLAGQKAMADWHNAMLGTKQAGLAQKGQTAIYNPGQGWQQGPAGYYGASAPDNSADQ